MFLLRNVCVRSVSESARKQTDEHTTGGARWRVYRKSLHIRISEDTGYGGHTQLEARDAKLFIYDGIVSQEPNLYRRRKTVHSIKN
jgi:hypothetical protein